MFLLEIADGRRADNRGRLSVDERVEASALRSPLCSPLWNPLGEEDAVTITTHSKFNADNISVCFTFSGHSLNGQYEKKVDQLIRDCTEVMGPPRRYMYLRMLPNAIHIRVVVPDDLQYVRVRQYDHSPSASSRKRCLGTENQIRQNCAHSSVRDHGDKFLNQSCQVSRVWLSFAFGRLAGELPLTIPSSSQAFSVVQNPTAASSYVLHSPHMGHRCCSI